MIIWLFGLYSWLLVGAVIGLTAAFTLPGQARPGAAAALLVGCGGAIFGGLLATFLGFGGLASFDIRSLAAATLASVAVLVWWRVAKLAFAEA